MKQAILLDENDTVITLLAPATAGEKFAITDAAGRSCGEIIVTENVPFAHKVAIKVMRRGDKVIKLNTTIGLASNDIPAGSYAHVHNIVSIEGRRAVR